MLDIFVQSANNEAFCKKSPNQCEKSPYALVAGMTARKRDSHVDGAPDKVILD